MPTGGVKFRGVIMSWLEPYGGQWTSREAAHLLRRACFGASKAQLNQAVADGLQTTITKLFAARPLPEPPVDQTSGVSWTSGDNYDPSNGANYYYQGTRAWLVGIMVQEEPSIREKLTLFWMNHFATEGSIVRNAVYTYKMMSYLREHGLGSFRDMVKQITIEEAMLIYLNGNTNTAGNPNENYARELQELFTIGKGPEAGEGDYTNYTEQDVQAAAKVLTGWRVDRTTKQTVFQSRQHDTSDKTFSHRYQNTVIKGRSDANAGSVELDELVSMILKQPATSEYIVTKLYRWFVNSDVTDVVRENVVLPLASQLATDWNVGPVLIKLLSSQHFFDVKLIGAQLRSPADLVIGILRALTTFQIPPTSEFNLRFRYLTSFSTSMAAQQMSLLEPPSVAGWTAYYQVPGFYREWLSTATLPQRNGFTDSLMKLIRTPNGGQYALDSVEFVKTLDHPDDALLLIAELNELFFAIPFTESTTTRLAEDVLMDGGRSYEWANVWGQYVSDPNKDNTNKVRTSLDRLFSYLFRMAEFQLF